MASEKVAKLATCAELKGDLVDLFDKYRCKLLSQESVNKKQSFIAFLVSFAFSLPPQAENAENLTEKLENKQES